MVSRLYFTLEVDGIIVGDYTSDVKQAVDSDFKDANIEVGAPGYEGPFNYQGFATVARQYFNMMIGPHGRGVMIQGKPQNIRMRNNTFHREWETKF
jgi:hypothetical protein